MPMEMVQRVTGHKTVAVVLKHYFKPGREQFKAAMANAMPEMLAGPRRAPKHDALELLKGMNSQNWRKRRARLIEILSDKSA